MPSLLLASWALGVAALAADAALVESSPARGKIVYIKTHSTGSSTVTNLLHRYCDNYGKGCYVPSKPGRMCKRSCLSDLAKEAKEAHVHYDVWPNHVIYEPALLEAIVPGGIAISIFREPFDRVMSAYRHGDESLVEAALNSLKRNEAVQHPECGTSGTKMSSQVPLRYFGKLDFVMITEKFNLGLVMLRRYLGWKMEDIIYIRMKDHTATEAGPVDALSEYLSADDANLTEAAHAFKESCMGGDEVEVYERAKAKFWEQYKLYGRGGAVDAEVKVFEATLGRVQECCETADPGDKYCQALAEDNVEWVGRKLSKPGVGFSLRKQRTGCLSLVPDA